MIWITIINYQLLTSESQLKQAPANYRGNGIFNDFMFAFLRFYEQHMLAPVPWSMTISPALALIRLSCFQRYLPFTFVYMLSK